MKKIKITLTNGSVIEKKVLTAFKGTYGDYVVLDNESVGSMGLPVILISKIQDNKLNTIVDANEWNAVKDNLRNIIAGNQIVKINVGNEYSGDDVYYKQLTLPVASFDVLKNTFDDVEGGSDAPSIEPVAPVVSEMPSNVNPESVAPEQVISQTVAPMPNVSPVGPMSPEAPVAPSVEEVAPVSVEEPVVATPEVSTVEPVAPATEPVAPEMPMPPINEMATVSEPTTPVVEPIPIAPENNNAPIDVAADKEAFLKACENMFDALVAKFNK